MIATFRELNPTMWVICGNSPSTGDDVELVNPVVSHMSRYDFSIVGTSASPLLAIFRTPLQGQILAEVYLRARETPLSIADLTRVLAEPVSSVHREVSRLIAAGLLTEDRLGRMRFISRPPEDLVVTALTNLLSVTFGPLPVLAELLAEVPGITDAYIYGSWAARYRGESGPVPRDVDVLVVGEVDAATLDDVADAAETRLKREVNIRRISPERWHKPGDDPFLQHVQGRPLVSIIDSPSRSVGRERETVGPVR
jgi:predicted nucleotidyltransferase